MQVFKLYYDIEHQGPPSSPIIPVFPNLTVQTQIKAFRYLIRNDKSFIPAVPYNAAPTHHLKIGATVVYHICDVYKLTRRYFRH